MGGVLRVLQFLQREVGRHNQRLPAPVAAVNHIVDLFQTVFCATLHSKIVNDEQGDAERREMSPFLPAQLAARSFNIAAKFVMHTGNFLLHEGVCNTPGKIAFSQCLPCPQEAARSSRPLSVPSVPHISGGVLHLRAAAVIVGKCPVLHGLVCKALPFQPFHRFKVAAPLLGGFRSLRAARWQSHSDGWRSRPKKVLPSGK